MKFKITQWKIFLMRVKLKSEAGITTNKPTTPYSIPTIVECALSSYNLRRDF